MPHFHNKDGTQNNLFRQANWYRYFFQLTKQKNSVFAGRGDLYNSVIFFMRYVYRLQQMGELKNLPKHILTKKGNDSCFSIFFFKRVKPWHSSFLQENGKKSFTKCAKTCQRQQWCDSDVAKGYAHVPDLVIIDFFG